MARWYKASPGQEMYMLKNGLHPAYWMVLREVTDYIYVVHKGDKKVLKLQK